MRFLVESVVTTVRSHAEAVFTKNCFVSGVQRIGARHDAMPARVAYMQQSQPSQLQCLKEITTRICITRTRRIQLSTIVGPF